MIEEQVRGEVQKGERAKEATMSNEFFLETIDTLSQEIKDLNDKCKYYEKHIHNHQKLTANKPAL